MNLHAIHSRLALFLPLLVLSACCSVGGQPEPGEPGGPKCSANGPPNSEHVLSSSCNFIVQTDKVCVYDGEGRLKEISSKPAGPCFCIGIPF